MTGRPAARRVLTDPVHFLAFGFGSGLAPWAPGTAGTMVGLAFDVLLRSAGIGWTPRLVIALLVTAAGIWICGESARRLGEHDHPGIVWDEIAGILLTMLAAPAGWRGMLFGFALFRLFDVLKPWPIGWADRRVTGGLGIMLDDTLAALFAIAAMMLLRFSGLLY